MVKAFDDLPWIVKLIFAFPGLDILWGIYRIAKGLKKSDGFMIFMGIVWILCGWAILWIIDIICVIAYKKPLVFA